VVAWLSLRPPKKIKSGFGIVTQTFCVPNDCTVRECKPEASIAATGVALCAFELLEARLCRMHGSPFIPGVSE